jgi:hypothetical protein
MVMGVSHKQGLKIMLQPSTGPKILRSGGSLCHREASQKAKNTFRTWDELGALLNFKLAVILDHTEGKLSMEDIYVLLAKVGELFCEIPAGRILISLILLAGECILFYMCVLISGM